MQDIQVMDATLPDGTPCAVLFSLRTYWTIGPVFTDRAEAVSFLSYVERKYGVKDPRTIGTVLIDDEFLRFVDKRRPRTPAAKTRKPAARKRK